MVVFEVVATSFSNSVQLMIGEEFSEMTAGGPACAKELIIRVIHLVAAENSLEAALVEGTVVGHKRQALDKRRYLLPHVRENRSVFGVFLSQAVHAGVPIIIVVRLRLNQGIEAVDKLAVADDDDTNRADACWAVVGGFEIDGGEVLHLRLQF